MPSFKADIHPEWFQVLEDQFEAVYFQKLNKFIVEERKQFQIFPPRDQIFTAFNETPFSETKLVIIGQDPYHGPDQANGMCFSVKDGLRHPPSLKNIFKEINGDLGLPIPISGDLTPWAKQGVLLINATLTVRSSQAASHQKKGWEEFTDTIIKRLSEKKEGLIFLLWGNFAIAKSKLIDKEKHHILTSVHPSPLSAHRGFLGCKHFSKANNLLISMKKEPINWEIK